MIHFCIMIAGACFQCGKMNHIKRDYSQHGEGSVSGLVLRILFSKGRMDSLYRVLTFGLTHRNKCLLLTRVISIHMYFKYIRCFAHIFH